MVWDATGVVLFVVWLVLPLGYTAVLGRWYVRQAREAAREAVWASAEAQDLLDDLESARCPPESARAVLPAARSEETQELPPVESPTQVGKHRLNESWLVRGVAL
jgi:hypothetical protein